MRTMRMTSVALPRPLSLANQRAYTKREAAKSRFAWGLLLVVVILVGLSLVYIRSRVAVVRLGYEIRGLEHEYQGLKGEQEKLKVELATLKAPERIEFLAKNHLGMAEAPPHHVIFLPVTQGAEAGH